MRALEEAESLGADPRDVALSRSAALVRLGELDTAESLLRQMQEAGVQDPRLYHNLGLVALERGQNEKARQYFERAVELAPEWDLPRQYLDSMEASP